MFAFMFTLIIQSVLKLQHFFFFFEHKQDLGNSTKCPVLAGYEIRQETADSCILLARCAKKSEPACHQAKRVK